MLIEKIDYPLAVHLAWSIPLFALGFYWSRRKAQKQVQAFVGTHLLTRLVPSARTGRMFAKVLLGCGALLCLSIAALGPRWGKYYEETSHKGRDILILLDCSRSMLAEDVYPNRLERAKADIRDLLDVVKGDRVGLVAFAGQAQMLCPLTVDKGFFHLALNEADVNSVGRGGTMLGDAIRRALTMYDQKESRYWDMILITDGEDHDSLPIDAAREAAEQNVTIYTIGIGDATEGRRVPVVCEDSPKEYLTHEGEVVWSRLDAETLRGIAGITGGRYFDLGTKTGNIGAFYKDTIAQSAGRTFDIQKMERYHPRFQWFISLALVLLAAEMSLVTIDRRQV